MNFYIVFVKKSLFQEFPVQVVVKRSHQRMQHVDGDLSWQLSKKCWTLVRNPPRPPAPKGSINLVSVWAKDPKWSVGIAYARFARSSVQNADIWAAETNTGCGQASHATIMAVNLRILQSSINLLTVWQSYGSAFLLWWKQAALDIWSGWTVPGWTDARRRSCHRKIRDYAALFLIS